eukprot:TRINITY_DN563_c0_g2_i1.p1 TRINITY_DN563_c0_g2~~TRINITY_DN563_c0_g2_i1.p1  ORF type:complete len:175 (+),score=3.68 TRINITY_DN563_c0_g2_i1:278-802(+)
MQPCQTHTKAHDNRTQEMHKFVTRAPKRRRDYDDWGAADVVTEARKRKLNPGTATVEEIRRWDDAAAVELSTEYDSWTTADAGLQLTKRGLPLIPLEPNLLPMWYTVPWPPYRCRSPPPPAARKNKKSLSLGSRQNVPWEGPILDNTLVSTPKNIDTTTTTASTKGHGVQPSND